MFGEDCSLLDKLNSSEKIMKKVANGRSIGDLHSQLVRFVKIRYIFQSLCTLSHWSHGNETESMYFLQNTSINVNSPVFSLNLDPNC